MSTVSSRPAVTLRLSGGLREKVIRSGYGTVADLLAVPFEELATELKLTQEQSNELIWQLQGSLARNLVSRTAYLTWEREATSVPITASSSALDSLFPRGKGVPPGKITEFCGRSGTGKTQLGIQLCINTQLPVAMGGSEGTSVFIDTEGSFIARRVAQIAQNSVEQMYQDMAVQGPAVDDLMRGIHYCRVHSAIELVAMVRMLRGIVQAHPKIKLVVIDTISSLFRSNFSDTQARTRLVANLGRQLVSIARDFDIAVVTMNQMTTKVDNGAPQGGARDGAWISSSGRLQPALGESWASLCTHRVQLSLQHGAWSAQLFKSPVIYERTVSFHIWTGGISDSSTCSEQTWGDEDTEAMAF